MRVPEGQCCKEPVINVSKHIKPTENPTAQYCEVLKLNVLEAKNKSGALENLCTQKSSYFHSSRESEGGVWADGGARDWSDCLVIWVS